MNGVFDGWESELGTEGTGRDHFFSDSGEGVAPIVLLGCSAEVSANVVEESEPGDNEVGCETF